MNYLSNFLIECFRNYDIYFLGSLIILKFTGIPTGSSIVVMAAGAFAYEGEFNIISLLVEICIFSCIGDFIGYIMWKYIGDRFLKKFLRLNKYFQPKILKSQKDLDKYGKYIIFYSRFLLSAIAPFINAACGILKYKFSTFAINVVLGNFFWTIIYLGLGYWFGDYWEILVPMITSLGRVLTFIVIVVVIIYLFNKRSSIKFKI